MRVVTATMGALVAPIAFLTLKASGQSVSTAMMAALLITLGKARLCRFATCEDWLRKKMGYSHVPSLQCKLFL